MYLMITHFKDHWDKVGRTKYLKNLIDPNVVANMTPSPTLFVKIDQQSKTIEKVWKGRIDGIETEGDRVAFNVHIEEAVSDYLSLGIEIQTPYWRTLEMIPSQNFSFLLRPPFFDELTRTKEWKRFEDGTFVLLKLLGLHHVFQFTEQRGEADGFFKFATLAVLYDVTLEDRFETKKQQQIENFCGQMKQGTIAINDSKNIQTFHDAHKQVWIITRGRSRVISKVDSIIVKEICIDDLITLYDERLNTSMSAEQFEYSLRLLGE